MLLCCITLPKACHSFTACYPFLHACRIRPAIVPVVLIIVLKFVFL